MVLPADSVARIERAETVEEEVERILSEAVSVDGRMLYDLAVYCDERGAHTLATRLLWEVLAVDPENIEALWLVGRFEAQAGDKEAGLVKMQKALDRMPPDMPRRKELENPLDSLKAGKADKD